MTNRQRLPETFLIQNRHFIPHFILPDRMLTLHYLSFGQFVAEKLNTERSRQSHYSLSLVRLHSCFTDCQQTLPWQMWKEVWILKAALVSPRGLLESHSPSLPSFFQMSQNNEIVSCTQPQNPNFISELFCPRVAQVPRYASQQKRTAMPAKQLQVSTGKCLLPCF